MQTRSLSRQNSEVSATTPSADPRVDTRNLKYQARAQGRFMPAANKSYRMQDQDKYFAKRNAKLQRDYEREMEEQYREQRVKEDAKWNATDKEETKKMMRDKIYNEKQNERFKKTQEKRQIAELDEAGIEEWSMKKKGNKNHWAASQSKI